MYDNLFPIMTLSLFLLTIVLIVGYEYYWEYREEKTKEKQVKRFVRKAVEIYGNNVPKELDEYIRQLKNAEENNEG